MAAFTPCHITLRGMLRAPHDMSCRQSNMEFAVAGMLDAEDVIATSRDPLIRLSLFQGKVERDNDDVPMTQDDDFSVVVADIVVRATCDA